MNLEEYNKNWEKELIKCKENPHYFFTTYLTIGGEKARTFMTEQEFNSIINSHISSPSKELRKELDQIREEIRKLSNRTKTYSKYYFDDEIVGKDKKGVIHLKPGITRKFYNDSIDPNKLESHINYELIAAQKAEEYYKKVYGLDDFSNEN